MEAPNKHENTTTHTPLVHHDSWTMSSSEETPKMIAVDEKYNIQDDNSLDDDSKPAFHNGEPVICTGRDVSRFVVDIRDDQDPALTFRSIVLGTLFAAMGAALSQVSSTEFLDSWQRRPPSQWYWPSLADILIQASADVRLHSLPVALDLYRRQWLGENMS